jgi:hypothetical protein
MHARGELQQAYLHALQRGDALLMDLMLKIKRAAGKQKGLLLSPQDVSELAEVTRELALLAEQARVERRRKQWRDSSSKARIG